MLVFSRKRRRCYFLFSCSWSGIHSIPSLSTLVVVASITSSSSASSLSSSSRFLSLHGLFPLSLLDSLASWFAGKEYSSFLSHGQYDLRRRGDLTSRSETVREREPEENFFFHTTDSIPRVHHSYRKLFPEKERKVFWSWVQRGCRDKKKNPLKSPLMERDSHPRITLS